jgi:hypothetical protein
MKALLFNCHGKMKIAPDFNIVPANKNVVFLCKEGKTLSVNQVKEFVDSLISKDNLDDAIINSPSIAVDRHLNPQAILDIYSNLKAEEKTIQNPVLLKIAHLKIEKLECFLKSMFSQHDKIEYIIPDLTLSHDDVQNGVVSQIVDYLKNKNFFHIGITIYGDGTMEKDQLYLMCDFQQLKNTNKVDVVYITPSQHIKALELSYYLQKFNHAYLVYNDTGLLEAFLNFQSDNKHLTDINNYVTTNLNSHSYDFGQENSDIVIGACREYDGFNFGYEV